MSPERERPRADEPLPDPVEQRELLAFAEEVRRALPNPQLPERFLDGLVAARAPAWSWRSAWNRNPVLRVAAALLILFTATVPVLAVIHLVADRGGGLPPIGFELPPEIPPVEREEWHGEAVAPELPPETELLSPIWSIAVERENRLTQAAVAWHERYPAPMPLPPGARERLDGPWAAARAGWELRTGQRAADARRAAAEAEWSSASGPQLWSVLQERLAARWNAAPQPALEARVRELWARAGANGEDRGWLAGWMAILDGANAPGGAELPMIR